MSDCGSDDDSDSPLPAWMEGDSLAPPCQADMDVVRAIIDFAEVMEEDVLFDLGCGDGRICVEAAESRGADACGVEIEEDLANKFRHRVEVKGLTSKVKVVHGDLRDQDLSEATVIVTYLLPAAMEEIADSHLIPLLRRGGGQEAVGGPRQECRESAGEGWIRERDNSSINKRCRIVCNTWGIPGARAVKTAGVGEFGQVSLRLFTWESLLPQEDTSLCLPEMPGD
ncbi:unnamed protein product [Discosporangium mesarthrocarpum]